MKGCLLAGELLFQQFQIAAAGVQHGGASLFPHQEQHPLLQLKNGIDMLPDKANPLRGQADAFAFSVVDIRLQDDESLLFQALEQPN